MVNSLPLKVSAVLLDLDSQEWELNLLLERCPKRCSLGRTSFGCLGSDGGYDSETALDFTDKRPMLSDFEIQPVRIVLGTKLVIVSR